VGVVVGADASADVVLSDEAVSRRHCSLVPKGDGFEVSDLGSRNGTLLDGVSIQKATVPVGAVLRVGETLIQLVPADEAVLIPPSARSSFGALVGGSLPMRQVYAVLERAAASNAPILLLGESGTGKELAARALHALSPRREKPFISENCAAFPASLIEAELFGSRKGAFTGSEEDRQGLFERADGGTLFLDEIGELPLELQAKLLRVLETSEVRRLGDTRVHKVDFRLVAATNRDLEAEVRAGRFRADLYYRLDGLRIELPTLAARVADIPELVDHFLRLERARSSRVRTIAPPVLAALCRRPWPGNVRELANEIARLCVLSEGDLVDTALLREPGARRPEPGGPIEPLEQVERQAIERAVAACGGDKTKAAELLGVSRAKVYQRWKEWHGSQETG
jgi:serine/threonine-protein kinase PknK